MAGEAKAKLQCAERGRLGLDRPSHFANLALILPRPSPLARVEES